eukprot:COSAG05_NODE_332_length_11268_cov_132.023726_6_plen_366_part_00
MTFGRPPPSQKSTRALLFEIAIGGVAATDTAAAGARAPARPPGGWQWQAATASPRDLAQQQCTAEGMGRRQQRGLTTAGVLAVLALWSMGALPHQGNQQGHMPAAAATRAAGDTAPLLLVAILSSRGHFGRRELMRNSLRTQARSALARSGESFYDAAAGAVQVVFVVGKGCDIPREARRPQTQCPDNRTLSVPERVAWQLNDLAAINDVRSPDQVDGSQRCGERTCVSEQPRRNPSQPGPGYVTIDLEDSNGHLASQLQEAQLLKEQETHGDIERVDVVDEYSSSAEKMRAFVLQRTAPRPPPQPEEAAAVPPSPQFTGSDRNRPFQFLLKLDDDNVCDIARITCGLAKLVGSTQVRRYIHVHA